MRHIVTMIFVALIGVSGCMGGAAPGASPSLGGGATVPLASGAPTDPFPTFGADVNAYRAPSLNPLSYNVKLHGAAQTHANDMSTNGFFSHTGSDGSMPWDRVSNQGYNWAWVGENIAQGQASPSAALTAWKNSPPHNAILLSSQPTEFALARASGNYWVMVLARPR